MSNQDLSMFHIEGKVKRIIKSPCDGGAKYRILVVVDGTESDGDERYEKQCVEIAARGTDGDDPWAKLVEKKLYAFDGRIERARDDGRAPVYLVTGARRIDKVDHGRVKWDDEYMRPVEWYGVEGNEPPLWREERERETGD